MVGRFTFEPIHLPSFDEARCLMYAPWHIGQTAYTPRRIGPVRPKLLQFGEATLRHYFVRTREWVSVVCPRLAFPKSFSDLVYAVGGRCGWNTRLVVVVCRQDKEHQTLPRVDPYNPQTTVALYQGCHFGISLQLGVYVFDVLIVVVEPELPAQLLCYFLITGFKLKRAILGLLANTDEVMVENAGIPALVLSIRTLAMALVVSEREIQIEGRIYKQFGRHVVTT